MTGIGSDDKLQRGIGLTQSFPRPLRSLSRRPLAPPGPEMAVFDVVEVERVS